MLPVVATGPGAGANPRAVTRVNRASVVRTASRETGAGGTVGGATRYGTGEAWHRRRCEQRVVTADPPA